jgi:hypothetical protein
MDGEELLERVTTTVQETYLKIGDSYGSISLYYPFEGDAQGIEREFRSAIGESFPGMVLEVLPQRLRVIVSEDDCRRISKLPVKSTIRDMVEITKGRASIDDVKTSITERYPDSRFVKSEYVDFDWLLLFPDDVDDDVYCLSVELGQVTYHRFSKEEFTKLGFEIPE